MRQPIWVRDDVVRAIHLRQLAEHGGLEGIRDKGLLASALARPHNLWAYSDPKPDLATMAAAYGFGIIRNHPFLDGNKRAGFVVMRTFLLLNGQDLTASKDEKFEAILAAAAGSMEEARLADWLRSRMSGDH